MQEPNPEEISTKKSQEKEKKKESKKEARESKKEVKEEKEKKDKKEVKESKERKDPEPVKLETEQKAEKENDYQIKDFQPTPINDIDSFDESSSGVFWKVLCAILAILLVVSIFTNGFKGAEVNPAGNSVTGAVTLEEAASKALNFINSNLEAQGFPMTAEIVDKQELDTLYKIVIKIGHENIESYMTKDGSRLFPQAIDVDDVEVVGELPNESGSDLEPVDVSADDDAVMGSEDAPVTVIAFTDFQCPACEMLQGQMDFLLGDYLEQGLVKFVNRDFPLNYHHMAKTSAIASECAHRQGEEYYWKMFNSIFENQASITNEKLAEWAEEAGVDMDYWNECFENQDTAEEVENDYLEGLNLNIRATPTIFVNGMKIEGVPEKDKIDALIQKALGEGEGSVEDSVDDEPVVPVTEPEPVDEPEPSGSDVRLTVNLKKFRFDPTSIEVNRGDTVELVLKSEDVDHSFEIEELGISKKVPAKQTVTLSFKAEKSGTFEITSESHSAMVGELVVN